MEEAPLTGEWNEEDREAFKIPIENRRNFIKKVLGIISAQMFITTAITAVVMAWGDSNDWFEEHWWIVFIFLTMMVIPEIMLICCMDKFARKVPINYILLLIFTLGTSGCVAIICSAYQPLSVLLVACLTTGLTCILTAFAIYTDTDFTKAIWVVLAFSCVLSIVGLILMFVDVPRGVAILISCLWLIIYGVFLIIDVQALAGGKKYSFTEEDYIVAALQIYLDVIMLFLELLKLLGKAK